jgi:molybdenum cofactor cytidylyltransferase
MTVIDAIVLAAGRSRRMGTQKLLLPFAGQTLIGHVVDEIAASPVRRVIVVVAADDNAIGAALTGKAVTIVRNPNEDGDMLSSVRAGLRALPGGAQAVLTALGDQPWIQAKLIEQIIRASEASGCGIVVPVHSDRTGHPVLFHSRYVEQILTGFEGVGLRGLLRSYADDVERLPVPDSFVLTDIDWPADYQRELARRSAPGGGPNFNGPEH